MKKAKILVLGLCLAVMASLCACGSTGGKTPEAENPITAAALEQLCGDAHMLVTEIRSMPKQTREELDILKDTMPQLQTMAEEAQSVYEELMAQGKLSEEENNHFGNELGYFWDVLRETENAIDTRETELMEEQKAARLEAFSCHWTSEYQAFHFQEFELVESSFTLYQDGHYSDFYLGGGRWEFSEDGTQIVMTANETGETCVLTIEEVNGVSALHMENCGYFFRDEEVEQGVGDKFVVVELSPENVHDYVSEPELLGAFDWVDPEDGNMTTWIYHMPTKVYEDDLVFLGRKYFSVLLQYDHSNGKTFNDLLRSPHFMAMGSADFTNLRLSDTASGQLIYIRAEYVADNFINEEGYRTLLLTDGTTLVYSNYDYSFDWDVPYINQFFGMFDVNYADYIF